MMAVEVPPEKKRFLTDGEKVSILLSVEEEQIGRA